MKISKIKSSVEKVKFTTEEGKIKVNTYEFTGPEMTLSDSSIILFKDDYVYMKLIRDKSICNIETKKFYIEKFIDYLSIEDSVIDQKYGQKNIIVAQSFNDGNMIRLI